MRILAIAALAMAASCAQSASKNWAQGSPVLSPAYPVPRVVNLGVRKDAEQVVEAPDDPYVN